MNPRDVIEQHADATAAPYAEKVGWYQSAGLYLRGTVGDLVVEDRVDFEPLWREYSDVADDAHSLEPAESELATVLSVTGDDDSAGHRLRVRTDQGEVRVRPNDSVEYLPAEDCANRCDECGDELDHADDLPTCTGCAWQSP
ncbi:hypothetical protein GCM10027059_12510 [Myceligenerans halotolerans]